MIIDTFSEENIVITFSYMPVWEMFFSMHVLSKPEHHQERGRWVEGIKERHRGLADKIQDLESAADSWNLIIDSDRWMDIRQMEIPEALAFLGKMNIVEWNRMTSFYRGKMDVDERNEILAVIRQYYHDVFEREDMILRPFLTRLIREEAAKCRKTDVFAWCGGLHSRLKVRDLDILFLKNRDFRFQKAQIREVSATVSTFVSPHLWMYERNGYMEFVKSVMVEGRTGEVPEDFLATLKALGDENRLRIIKELLKENQTTKMLAQKLGITEAAVSRHLSVLLSGGIVKKRRRGIYMEYRLEQSAVDFIPYRFYEWAIR